ncbi:Ribonuclease P protein subunit rpr2 [Cytospora mali]|uniref:Ribonuclease P protein subunit rpr2 n=1 Tax=Cytospora mali TaxID=578113 RepID=A0A194WE34_CYTMA|nr:Ribonuclease P protein subunit rpr2 [Valsa mali]
MAKKKAPGVQNKPMYSRISFLYQAAAYLAAEAGKPGLGSTQTTPLAATCSDVHMEYDGHKDDTNHDGNAAQTQATQALSRSLLNDLRSVTLKNQIRITPDIKRTICKYCDTLLVEGQTCTSTVENKSKGGRKPWADVLTIKCHACGRQKRFPVNASRQKRRPLRVADQQKQEVTKANSIDSQPRPQKTP